MSHGGTCATVSYNFVPKHVGVLILVIVKINHVRREIDTKKSSKRLDPSKFLWIEPFHKNYVGFQNG